jgi:hypothetical protein
MTRRAVFLLAVVCAGVIMAAGPANAQSDTFGNDDDYAALCIPLTVSNPSPTAGDTVTVSGTAATGGATILIVLNDSGIIGETTSDSVNRFFSVEVTIPDDVVGPATLQAFQVGDNTDPIVGCPSEVAGLEILAPPAAAEPLARTGANSTLPLTRVGFGLVAAGGLIVLVTRRRKQTADLPS